MRGGFFLCFFLFIITSLSFLTTISTSTVTDTLTSKQILKTNQTLESLQGSFVLGFFSGTYSNLYLAIWYKNIPDTVVWVANRDNPLQNSTDSFLKITDDGNIVLLNSSSVSDNNNNNIVWSSNQTNAKNQVLVLQLLDTGNLVLKESNGNDTTKYLWQSFDYPTDTLLPSMSIGWNFDKNTEKHLTSWKNTGKDPSSGDYSFKIDFHGLPEVFLWYDDTIVYRSGPWNGERLSGVPYTSSMVLDLSSNEHGVNYSFSFGSNSIYSRLIVSSHGQLRSLTWDQSSKIWKINWYIPEKQCDVYKECGPYGVCDMNNECGPYSVCDSNATSMCECVKGFSPKNKQAWKLRDGSDGCVRDKDLDCESDKFYHMESVKLPETSSVFVNKTIGIYECGELCHDNCSCTAYANVYLTHGGTGCVMWISELNDITSYPGGGQDLFVRLAASASDLGEIHQENQVKVEDLPVFEFKNILTATNNFDLANKIGQGGFGTVYKGQLPGGLEIAVKRLSKTSGQGLEEFMNEVIVISKLQHRNLVRLLGCCIKGEEKMLVYEYMPNNSLDFYLFDPIKKKVLDWQKRSYIIEGISRGLLYLHRDSRLRIIHRDLKLSNILLDGDLNPKISDFGMARIFGGTENEGNTRRIVGT
ncbi:S-locus-specific glycoprotein S13 isoform X2 [Lathyrus oleraceus]|uniref:S-locus-specific glycoprotein S13 isoform X2 n=2 Tax=Pisum sativum TaxID=3888 RepID=UPI0021CF0CDC|nr:S-locus-specific glycoprotein S13-like isoform X2 [Pisum sativum]